MDTFVGFLCFSSGYFDEIGDRVDHCQSLENHVGFVDLEWPWSDGVEMNFLPWYEWWIARSEVSKLVLTFLHSFVKAAGCTNLFASDSESWVVESRRYCVVKSYWSCAVKG